MRSVRRGVPTGRLESTRRAGSLRLQAKVIHSLGVENLLMIRAFDLATIRAVVHFPPMGQ